MVEKLWAKLEKYIQRVNDNKYPVYNAPVEFHEHRLVYYVKRDLSEINMLATTMRWDIESLNNWWIALNL